MQIGALLDLVDGGADPVTIAEPFGDWCDEYIRPWVEDHIARDDESVQRLHGADIDLIRPLTSTAIVDAAQVDQRILERVGGFLGMTALPATLRPRRTARPRGLRVRLASAVRRGSQPRRARRHHRVGDAPGWLGVVERHRAVPATEPARGLSA